MKFFVIRVCFLRISQENTIKNFCFARLAMLFPVLYVIHKASPACRAKNLSFHKKFFQPGISRDICLHVYLIFIFNRF